MVILTKIDKLCTTTDEDTTKVFYSRAVDDKVSFFSFMKQNMNSLLTDPGDQRGAGDLAQHDSTYQELQHSGGV